MRYLASVGVVLGMVATLFTQEAAAMKDYPIAPVPFTHIQIQDNFWSPRMDTNREVTLPANFRKSEDTGRIRNFAKAGGLMDGPHEGIYFNDSDVFKIVEGAAYTLAMHPDQELDQYLDDLITLFAAAQEEDGYLYTARTIDPENASKDIGKERWENIRSAHELYNVGHMYEAAVAHFLATGKRTLLDVAIKNADLVCSVFGPDKKYAVPGHEEIEIGLMKLYRVTGDEKYFHMAQFFIEERGRSENREPFGDYCQDQKPLAEQDEAVGHAVRAGYFYAGATDVAVFTENPDFMAALDRIWRNMTERKLYLTGGIGALHRGEQFGSDYELPNATAYAETCAAIANIFWNHRMFLAKGEAKYMDVLERALYNGFLSGVALTGDAFFYVNPLASDGVSPFNQGACLRQPWFGCSCCPTNIVRLLPSLPGYIYAVKEDCVYVNLYMGNKATFELAGDPLTLEQQTTYPWDSSVVLTVTPQSTKDFELRLRLPGWAQGQPVPGDLYRYADPKPENTLLYINDRQVDFSVDSQGYISVRRNWAAGDRVRLELPMTVHVVKAHEKVEENSYRVAIERGPLVYCAEAIDNDGRVGNRFLTDNHDWQIKDLDILPGKQVQALVTEAQALYKDEDKELVQICEEPLTLIPYYAWAHRGAGEMQVWIAADKTTAELSPKQTIAFTEKVSASHCWEHDSPRAMNDLREPESSQDYSIPRFTWWPRTGSEEWAEYTFPKEMTLTQVKVYWFDDAPQGGCRVPAKWEIQYKHGDEWLPVQHKEPYKTRINEYNEVNFDPVTTKALRLVVRLRRNFSAGILEWQVAE
ncbi:MAG: glycoside hydrolase family 127 protein [Candidatus Hydrogenedentales bacterium]